MPVHLARHAPALRRVHLRLRADRMGLVPGPCLPVRRRDKYVHRRDARSRLARRGQHHADLPAALRSYEAERVLEVLKIQNAARNSTEWFENVERYTHLEAEQFAYSLLTRSQRISHENLRLRDPRYVAATERWFAARNHLPSGSG